jgi:hypothetical protein
MLFIIFALLIFIMICFIAESVPQNSRGHVNRNSPRYRARKPPQIWYPKHDKKIANTFPQTNTAEPSSDIPCAPCINEFRRPRRAVPIKDMLNSKFNFRPERKQIERTPISEHDEEVYRKAERLRIQRENLIAEERNRRYFTQKQFERYGK